VAPFFLFLHTYEAHRPYTRTTFCHEIPRGRFNDPTKGADFLPGPLTIRSELTSQESLYVEALYDGGVRKACDATADLFTLMDTLGLWENTVVVVLSDHGEEFWDHLGVFGAHGHSLYAELLDVPFLVYSPEYAHFRIIDGVASLVDLVPTVLDLLDLPALQDFDGVSLAPLIGGGTTRRSKPILAQITDRFYREAVSVYEGDMKYISVTYDLGRRNPRRVDRFPYPPPGEELYAISDDRQENHNLAETKPRLTEALKETLWSARGRITSPAALRKGKASNAVSPELKAQLEALGYVE
jgi:arylsulfatase A-like enzyme